MNKQNGVQTAIIRTVPVHRWTTASTSAGRIREMTVPVNAMGIVGFVCGVAGLALFLSGLPALVLGVAGAVASASGMSARNRDKSGFGLAVTGMECALPAVVLAVAVLIATG